MDWLIVLYPTYQTKSDTGYRLYSKIMDGETLRNDYDRYTVISEHPTMGDANEQLIKLEDSYTFASL